MKRINIFLVALVLFIGTTLGISSCKKGGINPFKLLELAYELGWFGVKTDDNPNKDQADDLEEIEDDLNLDKKTNLPKRVDLVKYFPPIGNQGKYGTCVAWATGYNHRSFLKAKAEKRTTFTESEKFSPKYLFWALPSEQKGANCNGTGFEPAYEIMIKKGIAHMGDVPYSNLAGCTGSTSSWDASAGKHKIKSYRKLNTDKEGISNSEKILEIKKYLAQGRAVSFGAKLGDNFMKWKSDAVISSDTYGYTGQHAYHAMILCGYDDSKGTRGAFKVINSWGTRWGNKGYIWVDYNFFVGGNFAFCAFVAKDNYSDPAGSNGLVSNPSSGTDLMAWELYDVDNEEESNPLLRKAKYNAYNTGNNTVPASKDWNILYLYYNAYNANDYGILIYDYYSDDNTDGSWTQGGTGSLANGDGMQNYWNWVDSEPGHSVAYDIFKDDPVKDRFSAEYEIPQITGKYYFVVIVDGYNVVDEFDEDNNYFYLTDVNGEPIEIENGIIKSKLPTQFTKSWVKKSNPQIGEDSPVQTAVTRKNVNTYTTEEIHQLIQHRYKTGDIKRKAAKFLKNNKYRGNKTNG